MRRLKVPVRGTSTINRVDTIVRDLNQLKNPKYSEGRPEPIMHRLIFENFGGGPVCCQKMAKRYGILNRRQALVPEASIQNTTVQNPKTSGPDLTSRCQSPDSTSQSQDRRPQCFEKIQAAQNSKSEESQTLSSIVRRDPHERGDATLISKETRPSKRIQDADLI